MQPASKACGPQVHRALQPALIAGRNVAPFHRRLELCKSTGDIFPHYSDRNNFILCFCFNGIGRFRCHVQESATAYILTTDYLSAAYKRDPIFFFRVMPKYVKQCVHLSGSVDVRTIDDAALIYASPSVQELFCRLIITYEVIRDSEYAPLWEEYSQAFSHKFQDIANCRERHITEIAQ